MSLPQEEQMKVEKPVYAVRATLTGRFSKVSGAGGPAIVTIAAPGNNWHVAFESVHWSYSGAPTNGRLTITDGDTTYRVDITNSGPGWLPFGLAKWAHNAAVTITLATGGATITGCLNVVGVRKVTK